MADGSIVIDTRIDRTGAERDISLLERNLSTVGDRMVGVGKTLSAAVTLPILGIGVASAKVAMDFEAQMSRVGAIAGATGEELESMRQKALELGASTSKSASEVAVGMENMAAMGFTVNEVMAAMPGVIAAAEASGADMAQTADVVANSLTIFGLKAEEATRVADILAMTANISAADINTMQYALKFAGPSAAALGIEMEELSAAIAIMSDSGLEGSQIGTSLRAAMTRLSAPTSKAQTAMDELGLSVTDSNGKFVGLESITGQLSTAMEDMSGTQRLAALSNIFGAEAATGMLAVIEAGPEKLSALTTSLEESGGASAETAAKMRDNLKGALDEMGGAFETAAIAIGNIMTPALEKLAGAIQGLVQRFIETPQKIQVIIIALAGVAAAIGPLLILIGSLIGVFVAISATASFFAISIGTLLGIFAGVAAVFAAVIAAGIALYLNWDTVKAKAQSVFSSFGPLLDVMKGAFQTLVSSLTPIWNSLKQLFQSLVPILTIVGGIIGGVLVTAFGVVISVVTAVMAALGPFINALINVIDVIVNVVNAIIAVFTGDFAGAMEYWKTASQSTVEFVKNLWQTVVNFFSTFVSTIVAFFTNLYNILVGNSIIPDMVNAIRTWFMNMVTWVVGIVTGFISSVVAIFTALVARVVAVFNGLMAGIRAIWNVIKSVIVSAVTGIKNTAINIFNSLRSGVTNVFNAIRSTASSVWNAIMNVIRNVVNNIRSTVTSIFNAIRSTITSIFNSIRSTVSSVISTIRSVISSGFNAARSIISSVMSSIKSTISNAFNAVKNSISNAIDRVKSTISDGFNAALDIVKNLGSRFKEAGGALIGMLADGIKGAIGKATGAIESVVGKVRDFLPFSPAKVGPLDDIDHLNFDGPMVDSIERGIPKIQAAMSKMLQMPDINHVAEVSATGRSQYTGTAAVAPQQINVPKQDININPTGVYLSERLVGEIIWEEVKRQIDRRDAMINKF